MKGLAIGQRASASRVFTAEDVAAYRALTGDVGLGVGKQVSSNVAQRPLRVQFSVISDQRPGVSTAVPGPLLAGMFSDLLGTKLPGRGTNWLKQRLQFPGVVNVGEVVTATVEITRLRPEKQLVNLRTVCTNQAGNIACTGEALVLVSDLESDG